MTREELKKDICNIIDNFSNEELESLSIDGVVASLKEEQSMAEELIKINGEFKKLTKVVQNLEESNHTEIKNTKPYINMYNFINNSIGIIEGMSNANYINIFKFNTQFGSFKRAYMTVAEVYNEILKEIEILPVAFVGGEFDPQTQKVVEVIQNHGIEYSEIVEVVEQGFTHNGKLIKYAKVSVRK